MNPTTTTTTTTSHRRRPHRSRRALAAAAVVATATAVVLSGTAAASPSPQSAGEPLQILFGSSGNAETNALIAATERFTEASGIEVEVVPAQDLRQQLTQGFAGGDPPDVFYLSPEEARSFQDSLYPYGSEIEDIDDFYPALVDAYTFDDELYCVAKDFSNLGLVINVDAWEAAGLTDADVPTTWDDLATVSQTLTTDDQVGLVISGEAERVGAFMVQAGGWFVNEDGTEATANSEANVEALTYLQDNLLEGNFQFAAQVEAGWGGEAFGTGRAAMTIEGPWIVGALENDFPDINWMAAELPEGPAGPGTLAFTNCWGVAADGNTDGAVELVQFLLQPEEQQAFTEAFGVNPSRISLEEWNAEAQPEKAGFNDGIDYAQGPVAVAGFASALTDFKSQLEGLASGSIGAAEVLDRMQEVTEEVIADQG